MIKKKKKKKKKKIFFVDYVVSNLIVYWSQYIFILSILYIYN